MPREGDEEEDKEDKALKRDELPNVCCRYQPMTFLRLSHAPKKSGFVEKNGARLNLAHRRRCPCGNTRQPWL